MLDKEIDHVLIRAEWDSVKFQHTTQIIMQF
jgi:hypothetical protein